jgi:uncharacterized protein
MSIITRLLFDEIVSNSVLSRSGFHGLSHWSRVLANGRKLASINGADVDVIELFGMFHDSMRFNEGHDPGHGARAAEYALSLWEKKWFDINAEQMNLLYRACQFHTGGTIENENDITVLTCWDADRLDLGRVGIKPKPEKLCTDAARSDEIMEWAHFRRYGYW